MSPANVRARRLRSRVPGTFILVTSLNDLIRGGKYKGLSQDIMNNAEEVRKMMLCFDNAVVIGPGRAQTWGCDPRFDADSQEIMKIFRQSFPVVNPYRLYESMSKPDGWHFSMTCPIVSSKVQKLLWDATKLAKGLKVLRYAANQKFKPLADEFMSEDSPSRGDKNRWRKSSKIPDSTADLTFAPVTPTGFRAKAQATSETAGERAQAAPPDAIMSSPSAPPPNFPDELEVTSAKAQATSVSSTSPAKAQATLKQELPAVKVEAEGLEAATSAPSRPPPPAIPAQVITAAVAVRPPPPPVPAPIDAVMPQPDMVAETADWNETEAAQDVEMEGANHHPMDDFENDVMVDAYNDLKFISRIDMIVPGTWDQDRAADVIAREEGQTIVTAFWQIATNASQVTPPHYCTETYASVRPMRRKRGRGGTCER